MTWSQSWSGLGPITASSVVVVDSSGNKIIVIGPNPEIDIYDPTSGVTLRAAQELSVPGNANKFPGFEWDKSGFTSPQIVAVFGADGVGQLIEFSGGYTNPASITAYARSLHAKADASIGIVTASGAGVGGRYDAFDAGCFIRAFDNATPDQIDNQIQVTQTATTVRIPVSLEGQSWNSLSALLVNGWSQRSGYNAIAYRLNALGNVEFKGVITGGTYADGTTLFTLPVGYRPSQQVIMPFALAPSGAGYGSSARIYIQPNGVVQVYGADRGAVTPQDIGFDSLSFYPGG